MPFVRRRASRMEASLYFSGRAMPHQWVLMLFLAGQALGLRAAQDHVGVAGLYLTTITDPAEAVGGDQRRAAAQERVIHDVAGGAVVADRPRHALQRLLPAVRRVVLPRTQVIIDLPNGRWLSTSSPASGPAITHAIPPRLVPPVIMALTDDQLLLAPEHKCSW